MNIMNDDDNNNISGDVYNNVLVRYILEVFCDGKKK